VNRKTGLYTQDILQILLFHEVARVQRYPIPLSILRIGVQYNSKPTVEVVEAARQITAHILGANLRGPDVAGHYETDYLIILPVTDEAGALTTAKRLTRLLYTVHPLKSGRQLDLVSHIGVAAIAPKTPIPVEAFLTQATRALIEARKRAPGAVVPASELESELKPSQPQSPGKPSRQ
jgi:diguanylate cyclase (GGDEF)-like protein